MEFLTGLFHSQKLMVLYVMKSRQSCELKTAEKRPQNVRSEDLWNFDQISVVAVLWVDIKFVNLLSSYVGKEPMDTADGFDKKEKKKTRLTVQPHGNCKGI